MRLMVTGAAPVSATVLTFLRAALGCQVGDLPVAEGLGPRPSPGGGGGGIFLPGLCLSVWKIMLFLGCMEKAM